MKERKESRPKEEEEEEEEEEAKEEEEGESDSRSFSTTLSSILLLKSNPDARDLSLCYEQSLPTICLSLFSNKGECRNCSFE